MFAPDDPLAPPDATFAEPWQAQVLAIADTMINAGTFSAGDWAQALGAALKTASETGRPDTSETYYLCALHALESLTPIEKPALENRKETWAKAYLNTPHGKPVLLEAGQD